MNSRAKGNRAEELVKKYLENRGYLVIRSPRTQQAVFIGGRRKYVSRSNDFFNLYDLIAKKENKTLWIQVKSNLCNAYSVKPEIFEFAKQYCDDNSESCEIWVYQKNKGYAVFRINGDSWKRENISF